MSPHGHLEFPTARAMEASDASGPRPRRAGQQGEPHEHVAEREELSVLVVEDNVADFYLVRELIHDINSVAIYQQFKLQHARKLAEAIDFADREEFDIILLDLSLPDADGTDTLRRMRSAVPDRAIIVLSGLGDLDTAIRAVYEGAQDYLVKGTTDGNLLLRSMLYSYERVKRHQEERALNEQMGHSERLKSLGLFAGGVAHDFNNLLMAMMGNLELAKMRVGSGAPTAMPYLDRVAKAMQLCASLTKQLLAYGGAATLRFEQIDLSEVASGLRELLRSAIPKKVTLDFELTSGLPLVEADPTQLSQVLLNLIVNAADAMKEGTGRIVISTGDARLERDDPRLVNSRGRKFRYGSYVFLKVSDNGSGMPPEVKDRIFDPFYSTKGKGRGLGLSAVWGIVDKLHGFIEVDSVLGLGTSFTVYLPEHQAHAAAEPRRDRWEELPRGAIVIVDEPENGSAELRRILQRHGFTVLEQHDERSALDRFLEVQNSVQAVFLNVTLPDSFATFEKIRAIRHDVPVVFVSSGGELGAKERGAENTGFLKVPYNEDAILSALSAVFNRKAHV